MNLILIGYGCGLSLVLVLLKYLVFVFYIRPFAVLFRSISS